MRANTGMLCFSIRVYTVVYYDYGTMVDLYTSLMKFSKYMNLLYILLYVTHNIIRVKEQFVEVVVITERIVFLTHHFLAQVALE